MNIKVFSKKIWILFLLLVAERKHGGCSLFSFDAQHVYYSEHQRNNERCFPYFPLTLFRWAIVSVGSVWKKRCNFVLAYFPKRKWKEGKEKKQHKGKEERKKDVCHRQPSNAPTGHWAWTAGSFSGTNYVQKFSKNCQSWIAVGSSFQTQIILSYLRLQNVSGMFLWFCCPLQCWSWE